MLWTKDPDPDSFLSDSDLDPSDKKTDTTGSESFYENKKRWPKLGIKKKKNIFKVNGKTFVLFRERTEGDILLILRETTVRLLQRNTGQYSSYRCKKGHFSTINNYCIYFWSFKLLFPKCTKLHETDQWFRWRTPIFVRININFFKTYFMLMFK